MTQSSADVPDASDHDNDLTSVATSATEDKVASAQPDGGPAPTIIVLTEEALKPVDVEKIVALHADDAPTYRVLVPADTDRNLLSSFLDHLSLFEMREALEALKP